MKLVLHGYPNSSAAWRVRNVLAYKNINYTWNNVDIFKRIEEEKTTYQQLDPKQKVPCLEVLNEGKTTMMSQSTSIIEFLEDMYQNPRLLPKDLKERQQIRSICQIVSSGM